MTKTKLSILPVITLLVLGLSINTATAQDYDSLIQQALSQRNAGDLEAAERSLREAYPIPPNKSEVALLLGMVVAFQDRFNEALQILETALADYPDDFSLQVARARVLSFQGSYRQAMQIIDPLLLEFPGNTEALNLAARIAWYQMQYGRARDLYDESLVIDSSNIETLTGLYDVELSLGNTSSADRYLAIAKSIAPDNADVLIRENPVSGSTASSFRHQISTGYAHSTFDLVGFPQWYERSLEYRHLSANGGQQYLRADHAHRFNAHDTQVEAGFVTNPASGLPIEFAVAWTDQADFMPEYLVRLGSRWVLHEVGIQGTNLRSGIGNNIGTTVLTGQLQQASYGNGDVQRVLVGLEYYLPNANAWLTPSIGVVRDQDKIETFAWTFGAHWQITGNTRLGLSYSDAPETENQITTETRNYQVYARQDLGSRLSLLVYFSRHERVNSYTRENLNLSLQYRY